MLKLFNLLIWFALALLMGCNKDSPQPAKISDPAQLFPGEWYTYYHADSGEQIYLLCRFGDINNNTGDVAVSRSERISPDSGWVNYPANFLKYNFNLSDSIIYHDGSPIAEITSPTDCSFLKIEGDVVTEFRKFEDDFDVHVISWGQSLLH